MVSAVKVGGQPAPRAWPARGWRSSGPPGPVTVYRFEVGPAGRARRVTGSRSSAPRAPTSGSWPPTSAPRSGGGAHLRRPPPHPHRVVRRDRGATPRRASSVRGDLLDPGRGAAGPRRGARSTPRSPRLVRPRARRSTGCRSGPTGDGPVGPARRRRPAAGRLRGDRARTASARRWSLAELRDGEPAAPSNLGRDARCSGPTRRCRRRRRRGRRSPSAPTTASTSATAHLLAEPADAGAGARAGRPAVVTFDRHPATVVRPESAPPLLTDLDQKLELLAGCGIDRTLVVPFDRDRADETAEDFVAEVLVGRASAPGWWWWGRTSTSATGARATWRCCGELGAGHGLRGRGRRALTGDRRRGRLLHPHPRAWWPRATSPGRRALLGPAPRGPGPGGPRRRPGRRRARASRPPTWPCPPRSRCPASASTPGATGGPTARRTAAAISVGPAPDLLRPRRRPPVLVEAYLLDFDGDLYGEAARVSLRGPPAGRAALRLGRGPGGPDAPATWRPPSRCSRRPIP